MLLIPTDAVKAGCNWLGAALFLGCAGALYESGFGPIDYFFGWVGGCTLAAVLIAPRLRRFGRYTIPDFLDARYGLGTPRIVGIAMLLTVLGIFLMAQLYGIGIVVAQHLDIDFEIATVGGLAVAMACVALSSFRRTPWLPMATSLVAIIAYAATGLALHLNGSRVSIMPALDVETATAPAMFLDGVAGFPLLLCLIVGVAALPQIDMRLITVSSKRAADAATRWDFVVLAPVLIFASSYVIAADQGISADAFVLMAPTIAGLSPVFVILIAIGAFAILLLTATGLLHAILRLLSGDNSARDKKPNKAQTGMGVAATILIGIAAAYAAGTKPASILTIMAWGLSLAASGLFAPLVLGLWWKRTSTIGAACGMVAGFGVCLVYIVGTQYFPDWFIAAFGTDATRAIGWWEVRNVGAGLFGIPVALAVTILVSLVTPAPSPEMQEFVASLRRPRGAAANGAHGRE